MKNLITITLLLCMTCGCIGNKETSDVEKAKMALVEYVRLHPKEFCERQDPEKIKNEALQLISKEQYALGKFTVNLEKKTYQLCYMFGEPEKGFFENWMYNGVFKIDSNGNWRAEDPKLTKAWGK